MEKRSRAEYRRNSRNVSKVPYEYGSAVRQLNIAEPLKTPDESQQTQKEINREIRRQKADMKEKAAVRKSKGMKM